MWFGMIYTESLFLLTMIGCLLCARQGRWLGAGLWGLASALTRTPGCFWRDSSFWKALSNGGNTAASCAAPPP